MIIGESFRGKKLVDRENIANSKIRYVIRFTKRETGNHTIIRVQHQDKQSLEQPAFTLSS